MLIATDAPWVLADVRAALEGPGTTFTVCSNGRDVVPAIRRQTPDVAICDLQIGSMGGMAVTMALRLDESSESLPHVPVVMLLDRTADVHLARRSGAETWLVKPLDPIGLRRAVAEATAGTPSSDGELAVSG